MRTVWEGHDPESTVEIKWGDLGELYDIWYGLGGLETVMKENEDYLGLYHLCKPLFDRFSDFMLDGGFDFTPLERQLKEKEARSALQKSGAGNSGSLARISRHDRPPQTGSTHSKGRS